MKVFVYGYRNFDEEQFFSQFGEEFGAEVAFSRAGACRENAELARGYDYVSVMMDPLDREALAAFKAAGVKMLSSRTIGYDHIDLDAARELGLRIGHATYPPDAVAEYAVMLLLMCARKMRSIMERANIGDFTLHGLRGRDLSSMTVGVMGTGSIGSGIVRRLAAFGCKILVCDKKEKEDIKALAKYVPPREIYSRCDALCLSLPLTDSTFHMIDHEAIGAMQPGVIIINTARGALVDTAALIDGLESGKVGAAALDVVEGESGVFYEDMKGERIAVDLVTLRGFPNTIVTPHTAFYSFGSVRDMVRTNLLSFSLDSQGKENPWRIV